MKKLLLSCHLTYCYTSQLWVETGKPTIPGKPFRFCNLNDSGFTPHDKVQLNVSLTPRRGYKQLTLQRGRKFWYYSFNNSFDVDSSPIFLGDGVDIFLDKTFGVSTQIRVVWFKFSKKRS